MSEKPIDEFSGVSTTGHEWDGIKELDNPMPRWWLIVYYATIVWAVGYMIAYPAWPLIRTATTGLLGYSSRADVKAELAAAKATKADYIAAIGSKSVTEILADEKLRTFAAAAGAAAFKVNCVQCHGSGAQGSPGYPNLNDDEWIWGGSLDAISQTITHGVRWDADKDTRAGGMPAFSKDGTLKADEIANAAGYVQSIGRASCRERV